MTLAQMFNEYLREENDVKHLLKQTQLVFESSLIDALWNFNDPQIKASEKGMIQIPVVVGVKIFNMVDNKFVVYKGLVLNQQGEIIDNKKKSLNPYLHLLEHQFTLVKNGQKIGVVTLYSSNQVVFDKVKYNFLVTIISAVIKTILLWVLFLWAFNKYLIRQLDIFCYTMENVDIDRQTKSFLTLETFGSHELIRLEYLFNNMLTRIIDNKIKLNILNKTLEEKIVTRTQELEKSKDKAETANRAKSTFLARMSHELRTPLNGILGFAQILQRDLSLTSKQQHGLNVIEQSGNHLLALIDDVLDLAKVESGKIELYKTDFNLPSLLIGVSEIVNIRAKNKGINFYLEAADELPNGVHGDERRLQQILLNLLGNAIKFTDRGGITLKVSKGENVNKGEHTNKGDSFCLLRFSIEDTGVGISPENLETIFKPFEQVGEVERQAKGTGLGLAISKNLVELMGGQLCVNSQINVGTQFWFELALKKPSSSQKLGFSKSNYNATQQLIIGIKGEPPKILVVDDKLENQAVVVDLLSPLGFDVKTANDGYQGLEQAIKWQPDVIITDLIMPEMDGFELIRQLRQSPVLKEKVIIASSASVYEDDKQRSSTVGSDAFLPKPIPAKTLFEQLQHHLNLTWVYGDKVKETVEENHIAQMVFPPAAELEKLYESSLMCNVDVLEEQVAILAESSVKLKPFVTKMQVFLKNYQLEELTEWLEGAKTNDG